MLTGTVVIFILVELLTIPVYFATWIDTLPEKTIYFICTMLVCLQFAWWCLTPLSTIFQLYRGGQFYWWRKPGDPEKTTDLSQISDKLYHIMLYTSPWSRFELTTSVVIRTGYIGTCKSTTAPTYCVGMLTVDIISTINIYFNLQRCVEVWATEIASTFKLISHEANEAETTALGKQVESGATTIPTISRHTVSYTTHSTYHQVSFQEVGLRQFQ